MYFISCFLYVLCKPPLLVFNLVEEYLGYLKEVIVIKCLWVVLNGYLVFPVELDYVERLDNGFSRVEL